ncbi:MAG TPA: TfuA-like protein [Myxococcaceae bacterium]|jgi:hypothetical protein
MPDRTSSPTAPIIYLGPSLPRSEAELELPGGGFRPPVRDGDLYRARARGGSLFVIIDGVFFQEKAISPREIIDVLQDGACVVGAASMGALRAAECWPAGMRGVGSIYRLFRRWKLTSDDEVAVTFDPDGERPPSLALVNTRYAVSLALKKGLLDESEARSIVRAAEETFYAERTWRGILARAGVESRMGLEQLLAGWDLKREDARRVLRRVARGQIAQPTGIHCPRSGGGGGSPSGRTRERAHDALAGLDPAQARRALGHWHLVSGRYGPHALEIAVSLPELRLTERLTEKHAVARLLADPRFRREPDVPIRSEPPEPENQARTSLLALQLVLVELRAVFMMDEALFADRLWQHLSLVGALDAEFFRWRAIHEAAAQARTLGLTARPLDRHLAQEEIAHAHGFEAWVHLEQAERSRPWWNPIVAYAETRALARRMREALSPRTHLPSG